MPRRRTVLLGSLGIAGLIGAAAGATALAANGVIPGQSRVDRALGYCDADIPPAPVDPGLIFGDGFVSARRNTHVAYRIAYPLHASFGDKLPVCIMLHGYAGDETTALNDGRYPAYLAAAVERGTAPFALASVAGGNGYWHPHPGDDPLGMVIDEFLPVLASHGLSVDRVAVSGLSMGGYGAIMCGLTAPDRFVTVAANSPAFWHSYAEAQRVNAGAFGSAAEWETYGDLLGRTGDIAGLPLQIYIGASDPFEPIVATLRGRLADPDIVHVTKGCHDGQFWTSQAPTVIHQVGTALAA